MAPDKGRKPKVGDDLIDWFTIPYRTIYYAAGLVVILVAGGIYYWYGKAAPAPSPAANPSPVTTAHFTSIEGSVKVKSVGTFEWVTADREILLKKSDLVRTGSGSAAEITFFDGTVVHVRPDSLITIEETSEDPSTKQRRVAWRVSSGEVKFDTARRNVPGSTTEVSTPTVRATAGELSQAGVRVAEAGDTDVKVFTGAPMRVETKSGEKVQVNPNEALRVDDAGRAGPKVLLPGVPTLLAPDLQAELVYPDPARSTTLFGWKEVPTAATYHFQIDFSNYFNNPQYDRRGWKGNTISLNGLDPGAYYWRVASIDKDQTEGNFSEAFRFTIVRPTRSAGGPVPALAVQSLEPRGNIVQVKGQAEPGATVTINGQRIEVKGDGSFNEFITLEKPGRQDVVIRATGMNGTVKEEKRTVVVAN